MRRSWSKENLRARLNILSSFRASKQSETSKSIWMITLRPTLTKYKNRFPKRKITRKLSLQNCIRFIRRFRSKTSSKISMHPKDSAQTPTRVTTENTIRKYRWIHKCKIRWIIILATTPNHRKEILIKAKFRKYLPLI